MAELAAEFAHDWQAEVLERPPLISPARQFVYPRQVAGEEDTLARGALFLRIRPPAGGEFLATCARGFADPRMPTGVHSCPNPHELCAVAGGYAYIIDTAQPDRSTQIPLRPVVEVRPLRDFGLLLFAGFQSIAAWGPEGLAWHSARLSHEGLRLTGIDDGRLHGFGWDLQTDKEIEFALDLHTGRHTGGAFPPELL
jgi:hypothetical protein